MHRICLHDCQTRQAELEASDNPFTMVVMAHLRTGATRRDPAGRLQWRLRLMRRMYEHGYTRQDILELFRFKVMGTLGTMRDHGTNGDAVAGDGVFTLPVTLTEAVPGEVRLQVPAAWRGLVRRILSGVAVVPVVVQDTMPPQMAMTSPGNLSVCNRMTG